MQRAEPPARRWTILLFLAAAVIVVADQLTKLWIRGFLENRTIFEAGFFRLVRTHNTGAAFGLFQGHSFTLSVVASLSIIVLLVYALFIDRRFPLFDRWPGKLALGLILGGAAGNLIDRVLIGYVTDFISIGFWPAFNVADSAVVVGISVLAYSLLVLGRTGKDGSRQGA